MVSPCWVILNDRVPCHVKPCFFSLIGTIITDTENSKFWMGSEQLIYESLSERTVMLIQTKQLFNFQYLIPLSWNWVIYIQWAKKIHQFGQVLPQERSHITWFYQVLPLRMTIYYLYGWLWLNLETRNRTQSGISIPHIILWNIFESLAGKDCPNWAEIL